MTTNVRILGPGGKAISLHPGTNVPAGLLRRRFFDREVPESETWRTDPGRGLTLDRIANAISSAESGLMTDLCDIAGKTLDLDPTLASLVGRRFGAIESCEWNLTPAQGDGLDKEKAKRLTDIVTRELNMLPAPSWGRGTPPKGSGLRALISDLAWGLWDGRAAHELVWGINTPTPIRPIQWAINEIAWLHPRRLIFGPTRELRLIDTYMRVQGFYELGLDLEETPGKFITFMPRLFREYPEREGLAPRCIYWAFFKRFASRERMILAELFGKPWKIVSVEEDAKLDPDTLEKLDEDVEALGAKTSARMPKGTKLEIPWPHPDSGGVHAAIIEESDRQLARLVLGQTMTTEDGSSKSQSEVHERQQDLILAKDGWMIGDVIRSQLITYIVKLNAPLLGLTTDAEIEAYLPAFQIKTEATPDRDADVNRLATVSQLGVPIALDEVYEVAGLRKPADDEETIGGQDPMAAMLAGMPGMPPGAPGAPTVPKGALPPGALPPGGGSPPPAPGAGGQKPPGAQGAPPRPPGGGPGGFGAKRPPGLMASAQRRNTDRLNVRRSEADLRLAETATRRALVAMQRWVDTLTENVEGLDSVESIRSVIASSALSDLELREVVEETMIRAALLGAYESHVETLRLDGHGSPHLLDAGFDFVRIPFREAIDFFRSKQIVTRRLFDQLVSESKRRAFTVAGLAKMRVLNAAFEEVEKTIVEGTDLRDFSKRITARMNDEGVTPLAPHHAETVMRNATANAYAAGRESQMLEVVSLRPFGSGSQH